MTLDELKREILDFSLERDWAQFHTPKNLSVAVSVEAAELAEIFMWQTPEESAQMDAATIDKVRDEAGDVFICLVNLCARLDIDLLAAAHAKIQKNRIKYPVAKAKGIAKKHNEL